MNNIERIETDFKQAESILTDYIYKLKVHPKNAEDLQKLKLLKARENNIDFELELAEMICGDNDKFPYRSSYYLTAFFKDLGFNYTHGGSTRRFWVRDILSELDISQIHTVINDGLFLKKYFIEHAKNHNLPEYDSFLKQAIEEFRKFIVNSMAKNESVDLSAILDLNVNIELLFDNKAKTKDEELNALIEEAKTRFLDANDKQIALEKLWDAFERIKTYFNHDKKNSSQRLIGIISNELDKDLFEDEFKKLTLVGNEYRIRHHETDKKNIEKDRNINYLFFRMLSLIWLCIENINESTS
ncbi:MAG: hypothetical protein WC496_08995 [Phycisphaerae bacterium]|jgi:hypothetical protein